MQSDHRCASVCKLQMLQALREALEEAAPLGGSSGRGSGSTGESIREGLVQVSAALERGMHLWACH